MPNWCWTTLRTVGRSYDIERLVKRVGNKENEFDLNQIKPVPECFIGIKTGSSTDAITGELVRVWREPKRWELSEKKRAQISKDYRKDWKRGADNIVIGVTQQEKEMMVRMHGHDNGLDWCTHNWDTKWNSTCNSYLYQPYIHRLAAIEVIPCSHKVRFFNRLVGNVDAPDWIVQHWNDPPLTDDDFAQREPLDYAEWELETAWGPPLQVFDQLRNEFPSVAFYGSWHEEAGAKDDF